MTRVAILGATGYSALELMKLLLRHPEVEIAAVTSRQEGNPHIAMVHPSLAGRLNLQLEDLSPAEVTARGPSGFFCLPPRGTSPPGPGLPRGEGPVIHLRGAYRPGRPGRY